MYMRTIGEPHSLGFRSADILLGQEVVDTNRYYHLPTTRTALGQLSNVGQ
jgi:hypothetical protein